MKEKPLLLLLPGLDGTGELFKPLVARLPEEIPRKVFSYPRDRKLGYAELTRLVAAALEDKRSHIIVAESFSGPVAYRLAASGKTGIKSVIFVASFLQAPVKILGVARVLPVSVLFRLPIPGFVIKRFLLGEDYTTEIYALLTKVLREAQPQVLAYRLIEISKLKPPSAKLAMPCTYIQALGDKLVPGKHSDKIRTLIPNINVIRVPGPHFLLQANADDCARIISQQYYQLSSALNKP